MTQEIFFHEEQLLRTNRLWRLLIMFSAAIILLFAYALYEQLYLQKPFGSNPTSDEGLLLIALGNFIIAVGLPILMYRSSLRVTVQSGLLNIHYTPFLKKTIPLGEIKEAEACRYNAWEYGGWGIKFSLKGNGWAYTVRGEKAVQLTMNHGKRILVGSERPEELVGAIERARQS